MYNKKPSHLNLLGSAKERFFKWIDPKLWSIQTDAIIVFAIDKYASKNKVSSIDVADNSLPTDEIQGLNKEMLKSPYNLTPSQILNVAKDIEMNIRKSNMKLYEIFDSKTLQSAIVARYSVLRHFNLMVMKVLPFIGLEDAIQLSCRPCRQASLWGEPSRELGLTVMPFPKQNDGMLDPKYSEAGGKGLGPLLSVMRGSVFSCLKKTAVRLIMSRTSTKASRAEDDYDYPPDLPQVMLNRPKAAAGRDRKDPETRLSLSLFGQLFDELHFLDPSVLRLGYSHPMDDGQERCFKLKFEGEGVDDYGGPYREIFSQLASEIQAVDQVLKVETRETRREATRCVLPLLRPTPNAKFDDAKGNDKVIVQPLLAESRHLYLEMFHFLGQVIGISMRCKVAVKLNVPDIFWKSLVGEPFVFDDLSEFDEATSTIVQHIQSLVSKENSADELEAILNEMNWSTSLSGGAIVALSNIKQVEGESKSQSGGILKQDALLWTQALTWQRLHESDTAYFAIRDGFATVVPPAILPLLNGYDLEEFVCGKAEIDLALLANNTEYDDDVMPDGEMVKRFWRVLESFDHDDRASFLRFVWARSRLPNPEDFNQKFKLQSAVGDGPKQNPDQWLPKAHTCFFSLNLPNYTTDEIMAKQLRYGMYNCVEMDADFKLAENEMTGWDEADEKDVD